MALDLTLPPAELALALVDVPSVSGREARLASLVHDALTGLQHLDVVRLGDTVVARTDFGRRSRVVIAGHLDTVPVKDNLPGRLADGVLWGRGAADMKGGLAAMLSAAATPASPAPGRDVTWIFYDNEEVEYSRSGLGRVIRERPELVRADFGILCEPTAAALEGGCNGTLRAKVEAKGEAAHSARPWTGVNAIHLLAPALDRVSDFALRRVRVDGLEFKETMSAVGVQGGGAANVIPDLAALTVNYRFAPDKSQLEAKRILEALFDGIVGVTVTFEDAAPGARPGLDAGPARELAEIVRARGGATPRAKQGWTDVARLGQLGIPAVNFGPGDPALAHQDEERCPVEQIDRVAGVLEEFLRIG